MFAALQDDRADDLRRRDELNPKYRLPAISADGAHQNTGVKASVQQDGRLLIEDGTGRQVAHPDPDDSPVLKLLLAGLSAGATARELQLDPVEPDLCWTSAARFTITRPSISFLAFKG